MGLFIRNREPLSLSYGIFASYRRCGPFKSLRNFDLLEAIKVYKTQTSEATDEYSLLSDFPDYLIAHQYIELTPCRNIHLGEFNGFDVRQKVDSDE